MTAPEIRAVIEALTADGGEVRFVGGCVRDALAGRPVKDIDLATPLRPEKVIELIERAGLKAVPTGLAHGTVTAVSRSRPVEITTLRKDLETDGRHAVIAYTDDWVEDAARRDLTMNALSCTPGGILHDPFGGVADLEAGRIRFVGDARARIQEDYLRLLRFFRFQAHYGRVAPDPATLSAIEDLTPGLARLSGERVREELLRLLAAPDPLPVLVLKQERSVLAAVLPEAQSLDRLAALVALEKDLDLVPEPLLRLAALIDLSPTAVRSLAGRLRLSNKQRARLESLSAPPLAVTVEMSREDLRRATYRLGAQALRDLLLIAWAKGRVTDPALAAGRLAEALKDLSSEAAPAFPLTGADLRRLGVPQGPGLGTLLGDLEDWWLEQNMGPDRPACLAKAKERLSK